MRKRRGPKTDPCGTLEMTQSGLEAMPFATIYIYIENWLCMPTIFCLYIYILHTVCEVVSNPLHKVNIQANNLQFFNQSFVGQLHASIPDFNFSSQLFVAVKSACIVDSSRTESPLILQQRV